MATLYTDRGAVENAGPLLQNRLKTSVQVGRPVQYLCAQYVVAGTEVTADNINVARLPVGAVVIPHLCRVSSDGTGGTGAIPKIGDAGDDDRYSATSIAVASAANTAVTPNTAVASPYVIASGNETIVANLTFASPITVGKVINFHIAYILP